MSLQLVGALRTVVVVAIAAVAALPAFAQDAVFRPRSSSPQDFVELDAGSVFFAMIGDEAGSTAL